jgi:hypothetical protein
MPSAIVTTTYRYKRPPMRIPTKPPGYTERIPRTVPI